MTGLRPVVELMYSDFEFMAGDQIHNQAAKWSFMSGGHICVPMVLRTSTGPARATAASIRRAWSRTCATRRPARGGAFQCLRRQGLLKTAIRSLDPVIYVESQLLYNEKCVVPEEEYLIPFGQSKVVRPGKDLTIVAWSYLVAESLKAADELARRVSRRS